MPRRLSFGGGGQSRAAAAQAGAPFKGPDSERKHLMTRIIWIVFLAVWAILGDLMAPSALWAQAGKLAVTEAQPPKEIAEPIRAVLDGKVVRVTTDDKAFFE